MSKETRNKFGVNEDKPTDWFETLYAGSSESGEGVPWANMAPHPYFNQWLKSNPLDGQNKRALVVGCGMGDDAIALENCGFTVTAFDVAQSAIDLCKKRFPTSNVEFVQADLLAGVPAWHKQFDLVLEIFTIQALPPKYENTLIQNVSEFVADKGKLIVVTEVQQEKRDFENGPPWLLNHDYIKSFENCSLTHTFKSADTKTTVGEEIHLSIFER